MQGGLKGQRKELTTAESNESRIVTKVRWVVEAIHVILCDCVNRFLRR